MNDFKLDKFHDPEIQKKMDEAIDKMVDEHNLAVENLTRKQVTEVVKQLFKSGDIVTLVRVNPYSQAVTYLPYRRELELMDEIERLKNPVDGQTSLDE